MEPGQPPRLRLLGAEFDLVTPPEVMTRVAGWVDAGRSAVVANHNSHSLYLFRRSQRLREFFAQADLIEMDSVPVIAWGRLLGLPVRRAHRCTYLDWRDDFWRLADARGWKVFYLGGAPGVADAACARLAGEWPNVRLAARHGYLDADPASPENRELLARIAAFAPDVVFVGMGMPRQEMWILDNRAAFARGVLFPVGAAFDYEAGVQAAAPRWMGRIGLEWLFRLATQPRRLAMRYLIEPWFLLPAALGDLRARPGLNAARRRVRAIGETRSPL
ncbi:WecB/TagA/CpsF family glycosyltransferase [Phenylobacterium sp.]|jgi:N-acetylglucosaminyldiphosphoundecaprenol N-acetyl-beta-D-mannosaminyltransferase|uniref:WecB/TagA/CpsF family glycosyltransferase n=1 Tax=Phenylobacterium sp. TaxID=1871053 RepID=UPI002F401B56